MSAGATRPQIGKVHAVLGALGVTDRAEKLRIVGAVLYRKVDTTNDLSRDEAHVVIDTLQGMDADRLAGFVAEVEKRAAS